MTSIKSGMGDITILSESLSLSLLITIFGNPLPLFPPPPPPGDVIFESSLTHWLPELLLMWSISGLSRNPIIDQTYLCVFMNICELRLSK